MRRFDKKNKITKANILAEKRYLESKGLISESFNSPDDSPIGVNRNHEPVSDGVESQDDVTILVRIEVLKDALKSIELSGDEEEANRIKMLIQDLKNELDARKDVEKDFFGREINEEDEDKDLFTSAFNKLNDVTTKVDSLFIEFKNLNLNDRGFYKEQELFSDKVEKVSIINDEIYQKITKYLDTLDDSTYDSFIDREKKIYDVYLINDKKISSIDTLLDKLKDVYSELEDVTYSFFEGVGEDMGTELDESNNKNNKK